MKIKLEFLEIIALQTVARKEGTLTIDQLPPNCEGLIFCNLVSMCPEDDTLYTTRFGIEVLKAHLPYGEFNSYIHHIARENLKHSRKKELEEQHNSSQYLANRFSPLKPN